MGDGWDYKLRKMDIAWELASRIIPDAAQPSGAWTTESYIGKAQETLQQAFDVVDAVFQEDKPSGRPPMQSRR